MAGNWKQSLTARVIAIAAIAAIAGVAPVLAAQSDERQLRAGEASLRTGTTGNDSELLKTIPIGNRLSSKERVVMSMQPGQLGDLADGDRLDATAEVEVSVCLKPNELHGSDRPCIGRTYGYDPVVNASLVLASGQDATNGVNLGSNRLTCTQSQPNRNHHCVVVIDDGGADIDDVGRLPCNEATCHVNLVLSAAHPSAKSGDKLVVGADEGGKTINGDKGRINVARYRSGDGKRVDPTVTSAARTGSIPIVGEGAEIKERSIYSVELGGLQIGEQLVIEAKLESRIGSHPYNAFQASSLVLSQSPDSTSREGWPERVGDLNGQISESNGFNCTQGSSAHDDPCTARKVGVLEITGDSPKTLYINVVAGMAAQADFENRHRSSDKAKITDGGFLRVYRYGPERNDSPPEARD